MIEIPSLEVPSTIAKKAMIRLNNYTQLDKTCFFVSLYDENQKYIKQVEVCIDSQEINNLIIQKLYSADNKNKFTVANIYMCENNC